MKMIYRKLLKNSVTTCHPVPKPLPLPPGGGLGFRGGGGGFSSLATRCSSELIRASRDQITPTPFTSKSPLISTFPVKRAATLPPDISSPTPLTLAPRIATPFPVRAETLVSSPWQS